MTTKQISGHLGRIPLWMQHRISRLVREGEIDKGEFTGQLSNFRAADVFFSHIAQATGKHAFDHWGRSLEVFFSEPYHDIENIRPAIEAAALHLNCHWREARPEWNPPLTSRFELYPSPIE